MEIRSKIYEPFSYVDSALSVAYFNLTVDKQGDKQSDFEEVAKLHDNNRDKYLLAIQDISLKLLFTNYRHIYYHEWHHCLQNIFYPYQYLQSWRELQIAFDLQNQLRLANYNIPLPSLDFSKTRIELPEQMRDTITYSSMVHCIDTDENGFLKPTQRDLDDIRPNDLTLIDLIEDATSIFEYKIQIEAEGNGTSYFEWIKSGKKVYANTFRLLSKLFGKNNAYISLPPLVQLSFHTTWPMTAFLNLANFLKRFIESVSQLSDLGIDFVYTMLFKKLANEELFPIGKPNAYQPTQNDKAMFITHEIYKQIVNETQKHTIYFLSHKYLSLLEKFGYIISTALFHPYKSDIFQILYHDFLPPATAIRIHHDSLKARDSVIVISNKLKDKTIPSAPDIIYSTYLLDVIKRKDIAYSLCTDLNMLLDHNCHHISCRYHSTNICRRWTAIPKDFSTCGFPKWFGIITGRNINFEKKSLDIVGRI